MDMQTVAPQDVPEGAHLIDVREQDLEQLPEADEDLYLGCRSGGRSFQVAQWLNANGFDAINVGGGMDQWFESGLPIESDGEGEAFIL